MKIPLPGFRSRTPWKMGIAIFTYGIIIAFFVIASIDPQPDAPATSPAELALIDVKTEVQDMVNDKKQRKVVVWVTNNNDKDFTGSVTIKSVDVDGKTLGWDVAYPENLAPGKNTYAILWLKVSPAELIEHEVDGSFAS